MTKYTNNYKSLFNKCQNNIEDIKLKQALYYKNKKNALFKKITNATSETKILNASLEGYESLILYEDEYNDLIHDLMNDFKTYFKPFNVTYKKKNISDRGFLEILTEDINFILRIDWKQSKLNESCFTDNTSQTENNITEEEVAEKTTPEEENQTNDSNNIKKNDPFDELLITDEEKKEVNAQNTIENSKWLSLF